MKISLFALFLATGTSWCLASEPKETSLRRRTEGDEEASEQHFPFQSRIVGGTVADAKDYEFSVYLGACGGSLIHEDIVLTAAHCQPVYPESCRIGGGTKNSGVRREIVGVGTRHPRYNDYSQDYDIMLYKLASPVTDKKPVLLNDKFSNPAPGDALTAIGFGATFEGGFGSNNLRKVVVDAVEHGTCNTAYRGQVEKDIMFCAGVDGGGKDTCQGDSGGAIVDSNGVQVGVTSWGNGCANDGYPGVYARVSAVNSWIQERICDMSANPPSSCGGGNGSSGNGSSGNGSSGNGSSGNGSSGNGSSGNGSSGNGSSGDGSSGDGSSGNGSSGNGSSGNGSSGNGGSDNGSSGSNGSDGDASGGGSSDSNGTTNNDLVKPKGITLRVDINYDNYPTENAWVLYNDDTKEELFWSNFGDVTTPGLQSKQFVDLTPGRYVFLLLDEFWDGICCEFGEGYVRVYEEYPPETGRGSELRWSSDGKFVNAVGAAFWVQEADDRRSLFTVEVHEDGIKDSPYLPSD